MTAAQLEEANNNIAVVDRIVQRALQTLDDGVSAPQWECDDTLHECAPVCVESMGVARSKVSGERAGSACRCCSIFNEVHAYYIILEVFLMMCSHIRRVFHDVHAY